MRLIRISLACLLCLCGVLAYGAEDWHGQACYARAKTEARLIPMQPLGERKIAIDGKLDDWGAMRQDSFAIHQLLDHTVPDFHQSWKAPWEHQPMDAALIKLAYDTEALYLAVQVADDTVISPVDKRLGGDVVDTYLDLRPLMGDGPNLGHVKYTDGVFQIVFGPPTAELPVYVEQPASEMFPDWKLNQKVPRLGPFDAKGSVFPGGYMIEMRLPLSSIPYKLAPDRLTQPIGFEMMIADQDAARPKGQPDRLFYSCSGYSGGRDYFKSAAMFACTDPELRTTLHLSRLRNNPLKMAPGGDECEGWIITDLGEKNVEDAYIAASKAVPGYVEPAVKSKEPFTTYPCKALGLAFHHRRVLSRLPAAAPACVGNRYAAVFPTDGTNVKIDGNLGEWADFDRTTASIYENGNLQVNAGLPGRTDTAQVKLMTANDTLYVGMRVKDNSVINPGGAANRFAGDSVQLFLDVRSPAADANPMSSGAYTDGVYNFLIVPPTDDGQQAEFRQGPQPVRKAGLIEFASSKVKDGYTVEMAIPLASLVDKPTPGRFQQPFGSEVLVADIDKPDANGQYDPLLFYSWGSFSEQTLRSGPQNFSCTDYLPNRLPEIRALVDTAPAHIAVDFTRKLQSVTGFGGNILRDAEPGPHGGGSVPGMYGPGRPGTLYIAEHLTPAWINMNASLWQWGDPADPNRFGTWTPDFLSIGTRLTAKMLASMDGTPIDTIMQAQMKGSDSHGIWNKSIVDWFLISIKPWARPDTRLCLYVDKMPLESLMGGGKPLPRDLWPKYADVITSYLEYARKVYGIEFADFVIKNVPWGSYTFNSDQQEYADFLKLLGQSFEKAGLKTKLLLSDMDNMFAFRWYAGLVPILNHDKELQQYVDALGIEMTGGVDTNLATYRLWGDLAASMNKPLLITSFGRPYTGSTTYLFDEMRQWQLIMRELKPTGILVRQFVAEKSNKWLMVWNKEVLQDKDRGLPVLQTGIMPATEENALPSLRFWFTKQLCDLTPAGHAVQTASDHPQVLVTGFAGTRDGRDVYTLHISNAGPARQTTVTGLPATVKRLRIVRSGAGESFHEDGNVDVVKGSATIDLPGWSLVSVTTMPPAR